jgi:hypothetical protein
MDTQRITGGNSPDAFVDENEYKGPSPWADMCVARDEMNKIPLREMPSEREIDGSQS